MISCALTAACGQGDARFGDSPYAPGVARNEDAVDGLLVGNRLLDAREYELAIDAFSRGALNHGMSADILAGLGAANLGLGRLHTAERLLRDAVEKTKPRPRSGTTLASFCWNAAILPRPNRYSNAPTRLMMAKVTQFVTI